MRAIILAVGLAVAAGPALADEPRVAKPKNDGEKVICKERIRANSRFAVRKCLTKAEWEHQTESARSGFAEVQNRTMSPLYPPSGDSQ